ncbi:MAG: hypothetical protein CMJ40_08430 [Phycisphaerae bacterium]|nr:hypothetical protein [Phycisphaerae bacterium]
MFRYIRRIRRWHRRLDYQSADRRRTKWTTRVDYSLVLTAIVAFLIILVLQMTVERPNTSMTLTFDAVMEDDRIVLFKSDSSRDARSGTVHVLLETSKAGWPFTTADVIRDPRISWSFSKDIEEIDRPTQTLTPLVDSMELASPVRRALEESTQPLANESARGRVVNTRLFIFSLMACITWVLLWITCLPLLGLIGVGEGVAGGYRSLQRRKRRKMNRCQRCGYDLKGLDFAASCPECGELLT